MSERRTTTESDSCYISQVGQNLSLKKYIVYVISIVLSQRVLSSVPVQAYEATCQCRACFEPETASVHPQCKRRAFGGRSLRGGLGFYSCFSFL